VFGGGGQVRADFRGPGQCRVGLEDVAFYGFGGEDPGESLGEPFTAGLLFRVRLAFLPELMTSCAHGRDTEPTRTLS
jgi:hypothetical protein